MQIHLSMRSIYITPESGERRATTRHRRFLVHPSIPCDCSVCSLLFLSPERRIFSVPRFRRTYMKIMDDDGKFNLR